MSKVLIVEDDLLIADLVREELEADGNVVTGIATTVAEAVEISKLYPCDYAVIDIHLAHGDLGTNAARQLRAVSNIGIIFSTGNDDQSLSTTNGDAVMIKPYRMRDLGRAIRIVADFRAVGRTDLPFPRNFRCLSPAA